MTCEICGGTKVLTNIVPDDPDVEPWDSPCPGCSGG